MPFSKKGLFNNRAEKKASFERDVFPESETMIYEQLCETSHDQTETWLSPFFERLVNVS